VSAFLTAMTVVALYLAFCADYSRTEDTPAQNRKDA
jgi:hypothetical protein